MLAPFICLISVSTWFLCVCACQSNCMPAVHPWWRLILFNLSMSPSSNSFNFPWSILLHFNFISVNSNTSFFRQPGNMVRHWRLLLLLLFLEMRAIACSTLPHSSVMTSTPSSWFSHYMVSNVTLHVYDVTSSCFKRRYLYSIRQTTYFSNISSAINRGLHFSECSAKLSTETPADFSIIQSLTLNFLTILFWSAYYRCFSLSTARRSLATFK